MSTAPPSLIFFHLRRQCCLSSEYIVEAVNRDGGPRQVCEREGREVVRDRLQLEHRVLRPRRQQPRVAAPEELGRLRM